MINVANILGQRAISLGDAESTGTVTGIRFEGNRIAFVEITGGRLIPVAAVTTFEGDTLTYDPSALPTPAESGPARRDANPQGDQIEDADTEAPGEPSSDDASGDDAEKAEKAEKALWAGDPIGHRLLSSAGDDLGKLAEMHVGPDGVVVDMADDDGHAYAGDRLITVGSYAAIVEADTSD